MKKSYKEQWAAFDRGDMPKTADAIDMVRQIDAALPYLQDRPAYELAARDAVLTRIRLQDAVAFRSTGSAVLWDDVMDDDGHRRRFRIVQKDENDCLVEESLRGEWEAVDDESALRVLCFAFAQRRRSA